DEGLRGRAGGRGRDGEGGERDDRQPRGGRRRARGGRRARRRRRGEGGDRGGRGDGVGRRRARVRARHPAPAQRARQALHERAGRAILDGIGATPADGLRPKILYTDVIEDVTAQYAVIVNRNREASMILPGQTLLVVEMTPALFAAVAANAAERVAPELTLVTVSMIGAAGRVYLAGPTADIV